MKLNNENIKLVEGEYYGMVVAGQDAPFTDRHTAEGIETVYNIELIKHDLPDRMRYIRAISETEYEWADRDPAITHKLTDIRGLSVRYDRIVPKREPDGYYVTDPFVGEELAKQPPKKSAPPKKKKEAGGLDALS